MAFFYPNFQKINFLSSGIANCDMGFSWFGRVAFWVCLYRCSVMLQLGIGGCHGWWSGWRQIARLVALSILGWSLAWLRLGASLSARLEGKWVPGHFLAGCWPISSPVELLLAHLSLFPLSHFLIKFLHPLTSPIHINLFSFLLSLISLYSHSINITIFTFYFIVCLFDHCFIIFLGTN